MRPFADRMMELMVGTARASSSVHGLPLLQRRDVQTVAIMPLTGDRGLAGSFNAQVLRHAFALDRAARAEGQEVRWLVAGRKGASTLRFRRYDVDQAWTGFSTGRRTGRAGAREPAGGAVHGRGDRPRGDRLQPLRLAARADGGRAGRAADPPGAARAWGRGGEQAALLGDVIYEPEPEEILARLLPFYLETELYRALLESAASEQGARMTAMRNASKNAGELIDTLTLQMNRARQAEITQEILEVVAGADALDAVVRLRKR